MTKTRNGCNFGNEERKKSQLLLPLVPKDDLLYRQSKRKSASDRGHRHYTHYRITFSLALRRHHSEKIRPRALTALSSRIVICDLHPDVMPGP